MGVVVTNRIGTIAVSAGETYYIKKQQVAVSAVGDNVIISWNNTETLTFPYSYFSSPSGASANAVASAIQAMLTIS